MSQNNQNNALSTLAIIKECLETLDDKKAIDVKIIKLADKSAITDYFLIASGTSEPHLRALRKALDSRLSELQVKNLRIDYEPDTGWAAIDGFDFIVHLFLQDTREHYGLEDLWKDGESIDPNSL